MSDAPSLGSGLASLAWVGVRTFLLTFALMLFVGIVLACVSYSYLSTHHWFYGLVGAVVALFEAVTIGFVFSGKRALAMASAHAFGSMRLGRSLIRVLFDRVLGLAQSAPQGDRGSTIARGLERVPLAQAETMVANAVQSFTGGPQPGGWFKSKIQAKLLDVTATFTLNRFRQADAQHGGVDLLMIKNDLESTVDEKLVAKLQGGLRFWTIIVIVGLPFIVAAQTFVVILFLTRKH